MIYLNKHDRDFSLSQLPVEAQNCHNIIHNAFKNLKEENLSVEHIRQFVLRGARLIVANPEYPVNIWPGSKIATTCTDGVLQSQILARVLTKECGANVKHVIAAGSLVNERLAITNKTILALKKFKTTHQLDPIPRLGDKLNKFQSPTAWFQTNISDYVYQTAMDEEWTEKSLEWYRNHFNKPVENEKLATLYCGSTGLGSIIQRLLNRINPENNLPADLQEFTVIFLPDIYDPSLPPAQNYDACYEQFSRCVRRMNKIASAHSLLQSSLPNFH